MELTDINTVKQVLSKHGFSFAKNLGQNFITNPDICPLMAEKSGITQEACVLEIGPGMGVLTVELAKRAAKVVSVEIDTRLIPVLGETLRGFKNVEVINADIMKTDLAALINEHFDGQDIFVCANLPYYITSPVIMRLLESGVRFKSITVMVQKEAAVRLAAETGSRDAGAISVAVNYYAEMKRLFDVSRTSFTPPPQVDSCVIQLIPRSAPPVELKSTPFFFETVKAAFSQRRKTAVNGISSMLGITKAEVGKALEELSLSPSVRAEALSMELLAKLSDKLYEIKGDGQS